MSPYCSVQTPFSPFPPLLCASWVASGRDGRIIDLRLPSGPPGRALASPFFSYFLGHALSRYPCDLTGLALSRFNAVAPSRPICTVCALSAGVVPSAPLEPTERGFDRRSRLLAAIKLVLRHLCCHLSCTPRGHLKPLISRPILHLPYDPDRVLYETDGAAGVSLAPLLDQYIAHALRGCVAPFLIFWVALSPVTRATSPVSPCRDSMLSRPPAPYALSVHCRLVSCRQPLSNPLRGVSIGDRAY